MTTYVVLDCDNICNRNWHAMRRVFDPAKANRKYVGSNMPALHGLLRDLTNLARNLGSARFTFCFDGDRYARREIYPAYKSGRLHNPDRAEIRREAALLRTQLLPELGYTSIFHQADAEADDLIAFACRAASPADNVVIVSGDTDLYQLLRPGVSLWNLNLKMLVNDEWVFRQHGIRPYQWAVYKAVAGCRSDNVPGVQGVGEKSAVDWLNDKVPTSSKKYAMIKQGTSTIQFYRRLTELPLEGLTNPGVFLGAKEAEEATWDKVMRRWGLPHLISRCPGRETRVA